MVELVEVAIVAAISAVVSFLVREPLVAGASRIKEHFRSGKEKRRNLSGDWYSVWETTVSKKLRTCEEMVRIKHRGSNLTIENVRETSTKGEYAYPWSGTATVHDNQYIIGSYSGKGATSEGAFYFCSDKLGKYMRGKWVGCTQDSEVADGYWVVARNIDTARKEFQELTKKPEKRKDASKS